MRRYEKICAGLWSYHTVHAIPSYPDSKRRGKLRKTDPLICSCSWIQHLHRARMPLDATCSWDELYCMGTPVYGKTCRRKPLSCMSSAKYEEGHHKLILKDCAWITEDVQSSVAKTPRTPLVGITPYSWLLLWMQLHQFTWVESSVQAGDSELQCIQFGWSDLHCTPWPLNVAGSNPV